MKTARDILGNVTIFTGLRPEVLDDIAEHGRNLEVHSGETIVREGEPGNTMFLILSGCVQVFKKTEGGKGRELARLKAGDFFGEMSIIECMPRSADVRAETETTLFSVKASELLRIFNRWPDQDAILFLNIARDLCRRLRAMDERFAARSQ